MKEIKSKDRLSRDELSRLKPAHDTFIGIDSDGCVFDTMEIKQKQCFHTAIVEHWKLQSFEALTRETAEFVTLYSRNRGLNRFLGIVQVFDLLRDRPEIRSVSACLPRLDSLRSLIANGVSLSDAELEKRGRDTGDRDLLEVVEWSRKVDAAVKKYADNLRPFPSAPNAIRKATASSDLVCISQTPFETVLREWKKHGLIDCVRCIAGPEIGSKADHIRLCTTGRYPANRVLLMGDSPGDLEAATATGVLFYPILPGREEESWQRFNAEVYDMFLAGGYTCHVQAGLIEEFRRILPVHPPWQS